MILLRGLAAFIATIPWPTLRRCDHKWSPTHLPVGMRTLRRVETAMSEKRIEFDIVANDNSDAVFARVMQAARRAATATDRAAQACGRCTSMTDNGGTMRTLVVGLDKDVTAETAAAMKAEFARLIPAVNVVIVSGCTALAVVDAEPVAVEIDGAQMNKALSKARARAAAHHGTP